MKKIFILIFLFFIGFSVFSQNTFQITYGGNGDDHLIDSKETYDGYILGGFTNSFGAGNNDFYIVKTDILGNLQWSKTYGSTGDEQCFGVLALPDGTYILSGHSDGFGSVGYDGLVIKTDNMGNVQWTRKIGGINDDFMITLSGTDNYVLVGTTKSFGMGASDIFLCKMDSSGNVLWTKTIGGTSYEWGFHCTITNDGGILITGITNSYGAGNYDIYLVKTDVDGNIQWTKTFGGAEEDQGRHSKQTVDGGYITAAWTKSFGIGGYDVLLIKTDVQGNILWSKTYGAPGDEYVETIEQTSDGGYILNGFTTSTGTGQGDVFMIKTDSIGNVEWAKQYGYDNIEYSNKLLITTDNGYALASRSNSFNNGDYDFYFIKTNTYGYITCYSKSIDYIPTTAPVLQTDTGGTAVSISMQITTPIPLVNEPITVSTILCQDCELPDDAGIISGAATICSGDTATYTMGAVNGAISYIWQLPQDAYII